MNDRKVIVVGCGVSEVNIIENNLDVLFLRITCIYE